ncbi:MAG: phosphonate C-P lyase system protein PhnG [Burkholderia sp.]|nr:phosphonate C-P lyase system protein PhnG [Burkholderia sp.]
MSRQDCDTPPRARTARQIWLATLAKAGRAEIEAAWASLPARPDYVFLRKPETGLTLLRGRIGLMHQFARGRLLEFDQHVFRAHLRPSPAGQLDLKCIALARQHAARLETARFLEENVHSVLSFRLPGAASAAPHDDGNSIGTRPVYDVFPSQKARTSST